MVQGIESKQFSVMVSLNFGWLNYKLVKISEMGTKITELKTTDQNYGLAKIKRSK